MSTIQRFLRQSLLALGIATAGASASAIPITLPTTHIDANAYFSFDQDIAGLMENMGLSAHALGNTKAVAGSNWRFAMPVTQVTLDARILPLGLEPKSGFATGSGLLIQSGTGALSLANFGLDFERNVLTADLGTAAGVVKNFDVYSFTVDKGLHVSTAGGLSMGMNLSHLVLTGSAQVQFANALQLDEIAVAVLPNIDFGTLDVKISPALRFGVSDKPLAAAVPETPTYATLGLGLLGLAFLKRRTLV